MRLLFISAGLMPKRSGGLPAYVAELREELSRRGHSVVYLDTNCQDASGVPRIEQTGELAYSFFNSGARLPFGGPLPDPLSDIVASASVERCFLDWVETVKPELIHFHETACLPLELVTRLRQSGHKLVATLHDYLAVCPTIQLLRQDLQVCRLPAEQLQCAQCVRAWPFAQLTPFRSRAERIIDRFGPGFVRKLALACLRRLGPGLDRLYSARLFSAPAYRFRRNAAVKHLRSFHQVLCISKLQQDLLTQITGCPELFRLVYPSRSTYAEGAPVGDRAGVQKGVVRFVALNTNQPSKGRDLMLREFRELRSEGFGEVELHVFGAEGASEPGVFFHGRYEPSQLESILSGMDAGIIPSIWPESYGYVGPEMLSRGVPLIVSSAGAMAEYVVEGENGLVFDPSQVGSQTGSLKAAMKSLATRPELLDKLQTNAPQSTQGIVKFSSHVDQLESIYRELLAAPSLSAAPAPTKTGAFSK